MDAKLLNKYESLDSVVFLDNSGGVGSSTTATPRGKPVSSVAGSFADSPLTVSVDVRRGRVFSLLALLLVVVLGLMFTFLMGIEVSRFEAKTKDTESREKLLDDYNSYSGIVSSAFGKPIELAVTALAQIITLRFMAQAFTQPDTTWKQSSMKLVLSVTVGYLVTNGFNALNVQLRPQDVRAVISTSDLTAPSQLKAEIANYTTTLTKTVSELAPGNPITNTVLRNAVLPRVLPPKDVCDWVETQYERSEPPPLPSVDFGFARRDWQSRFLQTALKPSTLRLVVNATDPAANAQVRSADLPMNASTAADLMMYFLEIAPRFFPWGATKSYAPKELFKANGVDLIDDPPERALARTAGLLPRTKLDTEQAERDFFLKALPGPVSRQFANAQNTSRRNIGIEFSHLNVTPSIFFDAVTFEVDVDPSLLASTTSTTNSMVVSELCLDRKWWFPRRRASFHHFCFFQVANKSPATTPHHDSVSFTQEVGTSAASPCCGDGPRHSQPSGGSAVHVGSITTTTAGRWGEALVRIGRAKAACSKEGKVKGATKVKGAPPCLSHVQCARCGRRAVRPGHSLFPVVAASVLLHAFSVSL